MKTKICLVLCYFMMVSALCAESWPGKKSSFHGYDFYSFKLDDLDCKVVTPKEAAAGRPWIWRARFWGHEPQLDIALLKRGYHVAYVDVAGLFGSPKAVARWERFYDYLTKKKSFHKKAVLEGISRGGLIVYNWASRHPDKVACIYADAPVCDIKRWSRGTKLWEKLLKAYGMTEEEAMAFTGNPVDNLAPLAKAKVPLIHVVGDADKVVKVSENTAVIEARYKALGGKIKVIRKPGVGHHPHSLKDVSPLVEFILAAQMDF